MFVYVGTFTGETGAKGIYVFNLDANSGAMEHRQTVPGLISPSFLAFHPTRPFLYAVERQWTPERPEEGAVAAFSIDTSTGLLTQLNRRPSRGLSPCYVSVSPSGGYALVAHYGGGQVVALPIRDDGRLADATDVVQHVGRGPDPTRQTGPHAHCIVPDASGRHILACDLGLDRLFVYQLDEAAGKLVPNSLPYAQVSSGAGPRHLSFHPSGRYLYVINELDSTLSAFAYDGDRGACQIVQTVSTLPDSFTGTSHTAQVIVHPSGRFVYGSNRGHDSIAIFAIDQETGRLHAVGHQPTQGQIPRNFTIDPTGIFLLAGNEQSGTMVTFRVNQATGELTATGHVTHTPSPVCILFRAPGTGGLRSDSLQQP